MAHGMAPGEKKRGAAVAGINSSGTSVSILKKCRLDDEDVSLQADASESLSELQGLLSWLRAEGAKFDGLYFRHDAMGGVGAFAAHSLAPGDVIAAVPRHCILTAEMAKTSELGVAALAIAREKGCENLCTDEVLLWIFMCIGRVSRSHPFHAYLAALPGTSPEPACWPSELRDELRSTPVGVAVDVALRDLQVCFDRFVRHLPELLPELVPYNCLNSVHGLLWARGMCLSRAYNSKALSAGAEQPFLKPPPEALRIIDSIDEGPFQMSGGKVNTVLLPLLDLLNHRFEQPIRWVAEEESVHFQVCQSVRRGDEVFNDYGGKSNEELLFSHGFCLRNNPQDAVALWMSAKPSSTPSHLTRFMVCRQEEGGVPEELWRALQRPQASLQEHDEEKSKVGATGSAEKSPSRVVVGVQEVVTLAKALRGKLQHGLLMSMKTEDQRRLDHVEPPRSHHEAMLLFISMYRQGQRDVLEDAMGSLMRMLEPQLS